MTVIRMRYILTLTILCCVLILNIDFANGRRLILSSELGKRKGTIKTIESEDGEVIDCVDTYKQPAFDHPLLKNHIIEIEGENDDSLKALQVWRKYGECPKGTIPIVRAPTSSKYGRKTHFKSHYRYNQSHFVAPGHEYAEVTMNGGTYFGAKANINVWTPVSHGTISVAQIWVVSSSQVETEINTVEAGWISDGYRTTGCYNLDCPGFVQVSKSAALGSILQPVSIFNGVQTTIQVSLAQHKENGEWWLEFGSEPIGYWPSSVFKTLGGGGDTINWGGEIFNDGANGHHTETQMGSGHFSIEGFGRASYFSNLMYTDNGLTFKDPEKLTTYATKPVCYDVRIGEDKSTDKGTYFFFGGPGYSDKCL
ncbi:hypothetical protein CsatA_020963 [Cannabis sativa]